MTSYTIDFRVQGDDLIADDISEILKLQPTRIKDYGWRILNNGKKSPALWIYDGSSENEPTLEWKNLEHAINFIYSTLKSKKIKIKTLQDKFEVYLWVGCFIDNPMHSTSFSIDSIQKLNDLNLKLYFETYISIE